MELLHITNGTYEEEEALIDISNEELKIILKGDYYHNGISARIAGFLRGLRYVNTYFKISAKLIDKNDELFEKLDFYDGSED